MSRWGKWIARLREGDGARRDLDEEMAFHVEELTRDLIEAGMDPREARREAVRRFGNRERVQERTREERGLALFDEFRRNLRFGFRALVRDPVFSVTFVLTLALTVGLGTIAHGLGDATLWRELPYPAPHRLAHVTLYETGRGISPDLTSVDGATWERIRDEGDPLRRAVFSGWASGVNLTAKGAAAYVRQQRVGAGYFATLGVEPWRGREFTVAEDVPEGPDLAILSHALWSEVFGGQADLLGSTIRLKGEPHTVIGIMPEGFRSSSEADVWTPLRPSPVGEGGGTNYTILARIPAGMSFQEAGARLEGIRPPPDRVDRDGEWRFGLVPLEDALEAGTRTPVSVLLAGIGLMLLIGWANLAGLQMARTMSRTSELATRRALGSGSMALVRQMAVENLLLAAVGGGIGYLLAMAARPALDTIVRSRFGAWVPLPGAGTAALVAVVLSGVALLAYGLAPTLRAARPGLARLVISGTRVRGRGRHVGRKLMLVGQMALVTVLVFSAGLLARSYGYLEGLEPGFDAQGVLTVQYSLDDARFAEGSAVHDLFRRSLLELERLPEVESAAVALSLPYERPLNLVVRHPGEEENLLSNVVYVTPEFFRTLRIPTLRGRTFDTRDTPESPTALVANQAFVERYMEGRDPLSSRLRMSAGLGEPEIVGVVGNVQQSAGWGDATTPVWQTPTLYVNAYQMPSGFFRGMHVWFAPSWVIRGTGSESAVAAAAARTLGRVTPDLSTARIATLERVVDRAFARQRLEAVFLLAMAGFALLLAGIGLYGIVAQEVLERRGEMGIRMALGASPRTAVIRVGTGGVTLVGIGLALGLLLAAGVGSVLESLVFGIARWDPVTLTILVTVLGTLALVASFVPAARIGRMDPARVLRDE